MQPDRTTLIEAPMVREDVAFEVPMGYQGAALAVKSPPGSVESIVSQLSTGYWTASQVFDPTPGMHSTPGFNMMTFATRFQRSTSIALALLLGSSTRSLSSAGGRSVGRPI